MLQKLVEKTVSWLIFSNVIEPEDRELYEYAAFNCIFLLLPFFIIIPFCFITGTLMNGVIFTISFFLIRKTGGGYHAKTPMKCWLYSCVIVMTLIYGSTFIKNGLELQILFVFMVLLVWILCPVEVENHKLTLQEKIRYRRQCRFFAVVLTIVFFMLTNIKWNEGAVSLSFGVCFAACLQLIGFLQKRIQSNG